MTPRWSRLALAAILAFGVCPAVEAAAADGRDRCEPVCGCDPARLDGPSLVVDADLFARTGHGRHASPLCAAAATTMAPRRDAPVLVGEPDPPAAAPGPRQAPWRLAPKTSPPVI